MKCLVVYYSLEGNTRLMAQAIAGEAHGDRLELIPVNDIRPTGFMRFFWGGRQVFTRQKPELKPLERNPSEYDLIFLGTPVWAFTFAPAIRSFLGQCSLEGKPVALFCCYVGAESRTFTDLRTALPGSRILGEIGFRDPGRRDPEASVARAKAWAKDMIRLAEGG